MPLRTVLPGLGDPEALRKAHRILRTSGLLGIFVMVGCYLAIQAGASRPGVAPPLLLAFDWSITMMGLTFLVDVRRGWLSGKRTGFYLNLAILFAVMGSTLTAMGVSSSVVTCIAIVSEPPPEASSGRAVAKAPARPQG